MITVREILSIAHGVNTIGIYEYEGKFIEVVDACTVMYYLDNEVVEFQVVADTTNGNIRMNLYIKLVG